MKNLLLIIIAVLISATSIAQNGINYKALIKDASGDVVASQAVTIQFQILEGATTNVYQETHSPSTDASGIAIVNIGEGTVDSGNFVAIDWGTADHFLNVQVDTGAGLVDLGTTEFKSVPFALLAQNVKNTPVTQFAAAKANVPGSTFFGSSPSKINFTNELFDLNDNFELNLDRFTVTKAGYYEIDADGFGSTFGNSRQFTLSLYILKNGSLIKSNIYNVRTSTSSNGITQNTRSISTIEYLIPGEYIEIFGSKSPDVSVSNFTIEIKRIR